MQLFVVKGKTIATPALEGTILPGITRKSIIELARDKGYTVEERKVGLDEVLTADECFCTGTAVVDRPGWLRHAPRQQNRLLRR